jgi:hemerythrin superfamily protein
MRDDGATGAAADAVELLTSQHREVEQLWKQLELAQPHGDPIIDELLRSIVEKLSQHDALEVQHLYPALRAASDTGRRLAENSLDDHRRIRDLLSDVDRKDVCDPTTWATLRRCMDEVMAHAHEEETEVFPLLRSSCGEDQLMDLGVTMATALSKAPTHPHPHMPESPLGAKVAGGVAGAVDKLRDVLTGY